MPNYDFRCTSCEEVFVDIQLPIADRRYPTTQPCPVCEKPDTIELMVSAPAIGDSIRQGRMGLPHTWTDKLQEMKTKHRHNTIKVPQPGRREV